MTWKLPDDIEEKRSAALAAEVEKIEHEAIESSWHPDTTDVWDGHGEPPPKVLERDDHKHLLYPGKLHWFAGEPESLKSWVAQVAAYQSLGMGGSVLYLDYESTKREVFQRLKVMETDDPRGSDGTRLTKDLVIDHLDYVSPWHPLTPAKGALVNAHEIAYHDLLASKPYALVVLDGVTSSMATEGLDLNDNTAIDQWVNLLIRPIQRIAPTAAVLVIDHVTKSREGRDRWAIGGQHKQAVVDGIAVEVRRITPLHRARDVPVTGRARLIVHKDRPGWIRSYCHTGNATGEYVFGDIRLTSHPEGSVVVSVAGPDTTITAMPEGTAAVATIMHRFATDKGLSVTQIAGMTTGVDQGMVAAILMWLQDRPIAWAKPTEADPAKWMLTETGRIELGLSERGGEND